MSSAADTLHQIAKACGDEMPLPPRGDEQVFSEPWQAQVFAMTVTLHERGLFTWPEWARRLGRHVAGAAADGSDYYRRWADAFAELLLDVGVLGAEQVAATTAAWHAAAARTPHGQPIELSPAAPDRLTPPSR